MKSKCLSVWDESGLCLNGAQYFVLCIEVHLIGTIFDRLVHQRCCIGGHNWKLKLWLYDRRWFVLRGNVEVMGALSIFQLSAQMPNYVCLHNLGQGLRQHQQRSRSEHMAFCLVPQFVDVRS